MWYQQWWCCGLFPMTFLQWVFLACFLYSSMGLKSPAPSCDPHDLVALKEFAGNLTNGSIVTAWSGESNCCKWDGVVCLAHHKWDGVVCLLQMGWCCLLSVVWWCSSSQPHKAQLRLFGCHQWRTGNIL
jgi:hypothetical protein